MKKSMKTYRVYAERVMLESTIVRASNEKEALEKAMEVDNDKWRSETDLDWQITNAREED